MSGRIDKVIAEYDSFSTHYVLKMPEKFPVVNVQKIHRMHIAKPVAFLSSYGDFCRK